MNTREDVWQESKTTSDGLSVTTYRQAADGAPEVVDEFWATWAELEEMRE